MVSDEKGVFLREAPFVVYPSITLDSYTHLFMSIGTIPKGPMSVDHVPSF